MVCSFIRNQSKVTADEIALRIEILRISKERAEFLLACPIRDPGKSIKNSRGYAAGLLAQIKESARLGISFKDTAKMLKIKFTELDEIAHQHKITFPELTTAKRCNRSSSPCLMTPFTMEEMEADKLEAQTFYLSWKQTQHAS